MIDSDIPNAGAFPTRSGNEVVATSTVTSWKGWWRRSWWWRAMRVRADRIEHASHGAWSAFDGLGAWRKAMRRLNGGG